MVRTFQRDVDEVVNVINDLCANSIKDREGIEKKVKEHLYSDTMELISMQLDLIELERRVNFTKALTEFVEGYLKENGIQ